MTKVQKSLFMMVALLVLTAATVRGQSALDGFDPKADDQVNVVAIQPDGKILIGGNFLTLSPNGVPVVRHYIARLNPDGTVDIVFNPNAVGDFTGGVFSMVLQADGKILVSGSFSSIGGQARNGLARLNPTTGLADSFNPNPNGGVDAVAVQADGKILVVGDFSNIGGQSHKYIARIDATTGLVDSFDPRVNGAPLSHITCVAVQADGKILVGGNFDSVGGQTRNGMARINSDGTLDTTFDPNANPASVSSITIQPGDGKILVGGFFHGAGSIGGQTRNYVARLDPTTGLADSFDPNANGGVLEILVEADGNILVGGTFTNIGGQTREMVARLDSATGMAGPFNPSANSGVYSIAVQADRKILVGGNFTTFTPNGGTPVIRFYIARLETDGGMDQTLNINTVGNSITATAVQPNGKVLIGGQFSNVLGVLRNNIARLNGDGTLDVTFNPNANERVSSIAVQADGKILVGGFFSGPNSIGGQTRNHIARLDATTGFADSFDPNANDYAYTIVVQADGKILVGGGFHGTNSIGGQTRNRIARLDATTGLADSFDPNASSANTAVFAIAVQADGKILAGGDFIDIGGQTRRRIARLDSVTGLADSFDPDANGPVNSVLVQPDGKILVGGSFTSIGVQTRRFIARLDSTTGLPDSFDPNATFDVNTIALQGDGKILVGGGFSGPNSIGGQTRNHIARLNSTTGTADSFDPNANSVVDSIAVQSDGKILAGGSFTTIGGQPRSLFSRLTNDTAALQDLEVAQTVVMWTRDGSSPGLTRVTIEYSTDNMNYTFLGNGMSVGINWTLTGLTLPIGQNLYIRARGYYRSGTQDGSESITESVRNVFLNGPAGTPTPTPTATATSTPTATATATPTATVAPSATSTPTTTPRPATLGNISTRLRVETGDNALIGGFIITGTQQKKVIVRAIGPSLPVAGALADPTLELRDSTGGLIRSNDNWRSDQEAEIIATTIPPTNDLESAIVATLPANGSGYTAIVRGLNDGTGIGLVEVYDLDRTVDSKLANISTRGLVQTGDDAMIAGTIVLGQTAQRVLLRAIGPSLPVPGALTDPTLELRDGNGALLRANDNWRSDQEAEIIATGIPPNNDLESAIVQTLPANGAAYTAIVSGLNGTTGVALVEVYALN